jgi:hypothetical protein
MGCPLCPWSMVHQARSVCRHHLRGHLRAEHGLCLAESVRVAQQAPAALSPPGDLLSKG